MVSRWRRSTAIEIRSAIAAVSFPPCFECHAALPERALRFCFVLLVPLRDLRVQIPAVEIEARLAGEFFDFVHATFSRDTEIQQPHPQPERRYCRCNSEHRPLCPQNATGERNVSPRIALRRCPICAALFGLMLECSTRTLPVWNSTVWFFISCERGGEFRAIDAGIDISGPATSSFSNPSIGPMPATISSAIFRGALRSFLANSKASGRAYSPSSTRGGCSTTNLGRSRS